MKSFSSALEYIRQHVVVAGFAAFVCGCLTGSLVAEAACEKPPRLTLQLDDTSQPGKLIVAAVNNPAAAGGLKQGDEIREVCVPVTDIAQYKELASLVQLGGSSYLRLRHDYVNAGPRPMRVPGGTFPPNVESVDGKLIVQGATLMAPTTDQSRLVDAASMEVVGACVEVTSVEAFARARSPFMKWTSGHESEISNFAPIEVHARRGHDWTIASLRPEFIE